MMHTNTTQNIIYRILASTKSRFSVFCLVLMMLVVNASYAQWPDVGNAAQKMEFRIFPNPNAGDKINLELQNVESASIEVVIYNTIGSVILKKQVSAQGVCQILPEERLPRGLYFITIDSGKSKASQRLVVTY